jgi:PqqD family protein of HPr-rel-A system
VSSSERIYRRLGLGAVLFDRRSWQTHILNPAAAGVYESLAANPGHEPLDAAGLLRLLEDELKLDPESSEARQLASIFQQVGVVD